MNEEKKEMKLVCRMSYTLATSPGGRCLQVLCQESSFASMEMCRAYYAAVSKPETAKGPCIPVSFHGALPPQGWTPA